MYVSSGRPLKSEPLLRYTSRSGPRSRTESGYGAFFLFVVRVPASQH
jgi:hypothetical protein